MLHDSTDSACVFDQIENAIHHTAANAMLALVKVGGQHVLRSAPHAFEKLRSLSQDTTNTLHGADRLLLLESIIVLASSLSPADYNVGVAEVLRGQGADSGGGALHV